MVEFKETLTPYIGRRKGFSALLSVELVEWGQIVVKFAFDHFRSLVGRAHDFRIGLQALQTVADVTEVQEGGQLESLDPPDEELEKVLSPLVTYVQNKLKLSSTVAGFRRLCVMFPLKSPCIHSEISLSTQ